MSDEKRAEEGVEAGTGQAKDEFLPEEPGHLDLIPFTGRDGEIDRIVGALEAVRVVVVAGLPGIGKTALLARAALRAVEARHFRFLSAELTDRNDLFEQIDIGLRHHGDDGFTPYLSQDGYGFEERLQTLLALMQKQKYLLVLDDVHALGVSRAEYLVSNLAAHLGDSRSLIASRIRMGRDPGDRFQMTLGGLEEEAALNLLRNLLPGKRIEGAAEHDLRDLARRLGGHPLSLRLAAGMLRSGEVKPRDLQMRGGEELRSSLEPQILEKVHDSLAVTARRLLSILSLFRGPAGREAVESLGGSGVLAPAEVLKDSFIIEEDAAGKWSLHPTMREYARSRLADDERHRLLMQLSQWHDGQGRRESAPDVLHLVEAYHYAAEAGEDGTAYGLLLEVMKPLLLGGRSWELEPMLDRALANIYEPDVSLVLTKARLLRNQGRSGESRKLLEEFSDREDPADRCAILGERGLLDQDEGRFSRASKLYYQALEISRELADEGSQALLLSRIATVCKEQGDYDRAILLYGQAAELQRAMGHQDGVAFTQHNIGKIHYYRGDHDAAIQSHERALELWNQCGDKLSSLLARNGIANVLRDRGRVAEAEELYRKNLQDYRQLSNPFGEGYTLMNLGHLEMIAGRYTDAFHLLDQSLHLARAIGNRLGEAMALDRLGDLRRSTGRYREARELYSKSLKIKRDSHNNYGIAVTLNALGDLERERGEYTKAQDHYDEAMKLGKRLRDREGVARSLEGKAVILSDRGSFEAAEAQFDEALRLRREMDQTHGIGRSLMHLGRLAGQAGDVDRAFDLCQEGMELFRRTANRQEIQRTLGCLSQLHTNLEAYDRAADLARESLDLARSTEDRKGEAVALTQLGRIALYQGDRQEARRWLGEALALREVLEDDRGLAATLEPLAMLFLEEGDYTEAEAILNRSIGVSESGGYPKMALLSQAHLALLELRTEKLDDATRRIRNLMKEARKLGFSEGIAYLQRLQGFLAYRKNQPEEAAQLLRKSRDLYRKLSIGREQSRVEQELTEIGKERLLRRLERRTSMLENSRRIEDELMRQEGQELTAMAVDLEDSRGQLPPDIKVDRRAVYRDVNSPLARTIDAHGGTTLRVSSGALLATFPSADRAVDASRKILTDLGTQKKALRIGLDTGKLLSVGQEIFGEALELAARFQGLARPGDLVLSEATHQCLADAPAGVSEIEPQRVRGRAEPVRLYRLTVR